MLILISMNYPLTFRFKLLIGASRFSVTDASGTELYFARQNFFNIKEHIRVYNDETKSRELFAIKADRVIDFSPTYSVTDMNGAISANIKRNGTTSLWRADYDLEIAGQKFGKVKEENPWVKMIDGVISFIPIVELFTGYFLHPAYLVLGTDGSQIARLQKKPAFFEGVYEMEYTTDKDISTDQQQMLVALLMVVVFSERTRG
jgi:hypothetical protein